MSTFIGLVLSFSSSPLLGVLVSHVKFEEGSCIVPPFPTTTFAIEECVM